MNLSSYSILIIVKGRKDHLLNTVKSIELVGLKPAEIVIVHMNESSYAVTSPYTVIQKTITDANHDLPLAAARNLAAKSATTNKLLFLDVDCLVSSEIENMVSGLKEDHIIMANPYYLPTKLSGDIWTNNYPAHLESTALPNPARNNVGFGLSQRYELFWSLGFAVTKLTFHKIGGFDESYVGYGAEDTDFALSARAKNVMLTYDEAKVYHQHHDSYAPPLNHFEDIITNARVFYKKWQTWPMEGWLNSFSEYGLIERNESSIKVLRSPTSQEVAGSIRHRAVS